jgi:outer membrane protein
MKNVNYVINGVLAMAVIILFILQFSGKSKPTPFSGTMMTSPGEQTIELPVAYVNVDSLLDNYIFSIDLNDNLTRKSENIRASLVQQQRNFQAEVDNFNYRLQNQAFTSQARIDQEQRRLQQRSADLEALAEKQSLELNDEYQRINMQLRDTIMLHLKEYNKVKGYQIIYSNTSSSLVSPILWADDVYNITTEFTDYLNKKWTSIGGN